MDRVCVVAVIYEEPEWLETKRCLEATGLPLHFVDRNGVGSLAHALNVGFSEFSNGHEYVWFVTNVKFRPDLPQQLVAKMDKTGMAAIHPSFPNSDHLFCRPNGDVRVYEVPFVEFTCPMVRADVFQQHQLDEKMPYWGHDLDWGYRVRKVGGKIGVHHGCSIDHEYIRNNAKNHPITLARAKQRLKADGSTRQRLIQKYGPQWKRKLGWM